MHSFPRHHRGSRKHAEGSALGAVFHHLKAFFDWMYGPNYDLSKSLDLALVNWIWELDGYYLNLSGSNRLMPETFFAIYTK
jgi:hypothetical protein